MITLFWIGCAFLSGSLPLSVWIGRWGLGVDIRQIGDGNPGGTNVWRAGGPVWGLLAILCDAFKGTIPVALAAHHYGWQGWPLVALAVAPVCGHAFSPFLNFRGGKALAVTFGVWTGLTVWLGPLSLGLAFALWLRLLKKDSTAVIAGSLTQSGLFFLLSVDSVWLAVGLIITLILIWKHWGVDDLA